MNAPVILPSYARTLLEEERAESRRATQTAPIAPSSHTGADTNGHGNAWARKFAKAVVRVVDEAARRIFAREGPEAE